VITVARNADAGATGIVPTSGRAPKTGTRAETDRDVNYVGHPLCSAGEPVRPHRGLQHLLTDANADDLRRLADTPQR
jgi:hypothetical protein